jgi:hypothetical protein
MIDTKNVFTKKIIFLFTIILVLGLANLLVWFFDPEKINQRASVYAWLDEQYLSYIDRIEITGLYGNTVLERKNNVWVMVGTLPDGNVQEYPVKQYRVEDLLDSLTKKRNYPIRSSAADTGILGLGAEASRITIRGGAGLPLLDLLIGFADASGKEIFLSRAGQKEIRSGADIFTIYTESPPSFWYDLRLFPGLSPEMVQRVHVSSITPLEEEYTVSRRNSGWFIEDTNSPFPGGESWVRSIVEAQGDDFVLSPEIEISGSLILELENGGIRILILGSPMSDGKRTALVSGSALSYSLTEWTVNRLVSSY